MFEVGFTELLLISALALLVLGPQKLPKVAQQIGRWVGRARAMARQFRDQLEEEAHSLETKVKVDPGIDTSLEPRPPTSPGSAPATPSAAASGAQTAPPTMPAHADPGAAPYVPPYTDGPEEEFYPPDHHMHPSNRPTATEPPAAPGSASSAGDSATEGRQGELDLTNDRDTSRPPP